MHAARHNKQRSKRGWSDSGQQVMGAAHDMCCMIKLEKHAELPGMLDQHVGLEVCCPSTCSSEAAHAARDAAAALSINYQELMADEDNYLGSSTFSESATMLQCEPAACPSDCEPVQTHGSEGPAMRQCLPECWVEQLESLIEM